MTTMTLTYTDLAAWFADRYGRPLPNAPRVIETFHRADLVRLCTHHYHIMGAALFRKVERAAYRMRDNPYSHAPWGDTLFIVELAAVDKEAVRRLFAAMDCRVGRYRYIAFQRGPDKPVKFYDAKRILNLFFNTNQGERNGELIQQRYA